MGAFDDLIPRGPAQTISPSNQPQGNGSGVFDDLIPGVRPSVPKPPQKQTIPFGRIGREAVEALPFVAEVKSLLTGQPSRVLQAELNL